MADPTPLETAAAEVGRAYGTQIVAAAKRLAEAAPDSVSFAHLWLGVGEMARLGFCDFGPADVAGSIITASSRVDNEGNGNGQH